LQYKLQFERISLGLLGRKDMGWFDSIVDYVCENPIKSVAMLGVGIATGGTAFAFAPAIGAAASVAGLGVAGGTLSGAAASSAGLAALGGGSLAAGGLGMAGGTAAVTAAAAAAGTTVVAVTT
jgi:hypothetical protein